MENTPSFFAAVNPEEAAAAVNKQKSEEEAKAKASEEEQKRIDAMSEDERSKFLKEKEEEIRKKKEEEAKLGEEGGSTGVPEDETAGIPSDEEEEEEKKSGKKSKGVQIREIAAQKEAAEAKVAELEAEVAKLKGAQGTNSLSDEAKEALKPFSAEQDPVKALAAANEAKIKEIEELKKEAEETGAKLREISIDHDPAFKSQYVQPFTDARSAFDAEIYEVDGAGNPVNQESYAKLQATLMNQVQEDGKVDPMKIKAAFASFQTEYEKVHGEKPKLPSIESAAGSLRTLYGKFGDMQKARATYDEERARIAEEAATSQQQEAIKRAESAKAERIRLNKEHMEGFKFEDYAILGDKSTVANKLAEAAQKVEGFYADPTKVPTHPEMVENFMKLESYDSLLAEVKELREKVAGHEKGERDELPAKPGGGGGGSRERKSESTSVWLKE